MAMPRIISASQIELCPRCLNTLSLIPYLKLRDERERLDMPDIEYEQIEDLNNWFYRDNRETGFLQSSRYLAKSALTCLLCSFFLAHLCESWKRQWKSSTRHLSTLQELAIVAQELGDFPVALGVNRSKAKAVFPWFQAMDKRVEPFAIEGFALLRLDMDLKDHYPSYDFPRPANLKMLGRYRGAIQVKPIPTFVNPDSLAVRTGTFIRIRPLPSPQSPQAFHFIRQCLKCCATDHIKSCNQADEKRSEIAKRGLPNRMLDLGSGDEIQVRLIDTFEDVNQPYVALSHCWGLPDKRPLTTTKETIQKRITGIPWSSFPQTFQDAARVTKEIGCRYLWIDSLCIVQDDEADWRRESEKMGEVYGNAQLVVAASYAENSTEGLFESPRRPYELFELPFFDNHGTVNGSIYLLSGMDGEFRTSKEYGDKVTFTCRNVSSSSGKLATRAWATQEWLLARRIVFFNGGLMYWRCRVAGADEIGIEFPQNAVCQFNFDWQSVIDVFSERQLTYPGDRLIALEGIKSRYQQNHPYDVYYYGHWRNDFPSSLCWGSMPGSGSSHSLQLPSWSWASAIGPVYCRSYQYSKCKVESISEVKGICRLTIRGRLKGPVKTIGTDIYYGTRKIEADHVRFDRREEGEEYESKMRWPLWALRLSGTGGGIFGQDEEDEALLLSPVEDLEGTYKRVGIASICETITPTFIPGRAWLSSISWFKDVPKQMINLI